MGVEPMKELIQNIGWSIFGLIWSCKTKEGEPMGVELMKDLIKNIGWSIF